MANYRHHGPGTPPLYGPTPEDYQEREDAMNDCPHMNLIRVVEIGGEGLRPPQDGVFTYYCKECHRTLYVKFTDAPPIEVTMGSQNS
jgi:hypothetical protein